MPKAFPAEFRRDIVAVARKDEAPLTQIAKNFSMSSGHSAVCLNQDARAGSHHHLYGGSYSGQDLRWWADRIAERERAGKEVLEMTPVLLTPSPNALGDRSAR